MPVHEGHPLLTDEEIAVARDLNWPPFICYGCRQLSRLRCSYSVDGPNGTCADCLISGSLCNKPYKPYGEWIVQTGNLHKLTLEPIGMEYQRSPLWHIQAGQYQEQVMPADWTSPNGPYMMPRDRRRLKREAARHELPNSSTEVGSPAFAHPPISGADNVVEYLLKQNIRLMQENHALMSGQLATQSGRSSGYGSGQWVEPSLTIDHNGQYWHSNAADRAGHDESYGGIRTVSWEEASGMAGQGKGTTEWASNVMEDLPGFVPENFHTGLAEVDGDVELSDGREAADSQLAETSSSDSMLFDAGACRRSIALSCGDSTSIDDGVEMASMDHERGYQDDASRCRRHSI